MVIALRKKLVKYCMYQYFRVTSVSHCLKSNLSYNQMTLSILKCTYMRVTNS